MSSNGEKPLTYQRAKAKLLGILGRVREIMGALPEAERDRLDRYLAKRPESSGGYTIISSHLWFTLLNKLSEKTKSEEKLRAYLEKIAEIAPKVVGDLRENAGKVLIGSQSRKSTTQERNKTIGKAFETGITRRRMYKFMCDNYPKLLPARKKKDGSKAPFMSEEKMWESYSNNGGTIP